MFHILHIQISSIGGSCDIWVQTSISQKKVKQLLEAILKNIHDKHIEFVKAHLSLRGKVRSLE